LRQSRDVVEPANTSSPRGNGAWATTNYTISSIHLQLAAWLFSVFFPSVYEGTSPAEVASFYAAR
jgi:hypothetical protein